MTTPPKAYLWIQHAPVAQPRPRVFSRGGRIMALSNPKGSPIAKFKEAARAAASAAVATPLCGPLRLTATFLMPRPKRLKGHRRYLHDVRPDIDNLVKGLKDALTGLCWADDKQVCSLHAIKMYCADLEEPGVQVFIQEMQP